MILFITLNKFEIPDCFWAKNLNKNGIVSKENLFEKNQVLLTQNDLFDKFHFKKIISFFKNLFVIKGIIEN